MSTKRIGIIDSGIGGLCLLKDLLKKNHNAEYFYISDQMNVPYGDKTQDFMFERTSLMVEKLKKMNVDLILLACNTLTVHTIERLRESFDKPFVGIEPYLNYLNKCLEPNKKMALILTEATYKSERFNELQTQFDSQAIVDIYPLKKLALLIEKLGHVGVTLEQVQDEISKELEPLKNKGYTHLILGCTHYPIIKDFIEKELSLKTVDPHLSVTEQVCKVMGLDVDNNTIQEFNYKAQLQDEWTQVSLKDFSFLA